MKFHTLACTTLLLHVSEACVKERVQTPLHRRSPARLVDKSLTSHPTSSHNEKILLQSFKSNSIEEWSFYYTHGMHVAGLNRTMAEWTRDKFREFGISSELATYNVLLNYPISHSISVTFANGSIYTPSLTEDVLASDETTGYYNRVPTFHGYSFTGNASAEYIYVGVGQKVDYEKLLSLGVKLEGKIALAKYGGPFRGLKVKNAQEHGMVGCVIFTDPGSDGQISVHNGYAAYPNGPARNPSSVQRGSVQFLSTYPGDPTTPGYPSKPDSPRADPGNVIPQIPSLPISERDILPIIKALNGFGVDSTAVGRTNWHGKLDGVSYNSGPAPGVTLNMSNVMNDKITDIWNVIGIVNGTNSDEVIIIGNHRDAWIIGGAADPNSGTAVLVELAKAFGQLLKTGWQPRRTIVLASWDGEEYGVVGSTEWFEEYAPWLVSSAVVNLNIDIAVSGSDFGMDAVPELHDILEEVMMVVNAPSGNGTLYDLWRSQEGEFGVLGSGSDFTSFINAGIPAVDMGFSQGSTEAIYHYHSNYDDFTWMQKYGDPGFKNHVAIGQYLAVLAYRLSTESLLPYNATAFSEAMYQYFTDLQAVAGPALTNGSLDLDPLAEAIDQFDKSADELARLTKLAIRLNDGHLKTVINHKLRDFERGFTSQGGFPGREFYKHLIFSPGSDTGYAAVTFPGITEAITQFKNYTLAQEWVNKTVAGIVVAANILKT